MQRNDKTDSIGNLGWNKIFGGEELIVNGGESME